MLSAADALKQLMEGNARFAGERSLHPHQDTVRRVKITEGQRPFAAVLGCADSRIPPEVVFDQGLGDLFVVRVAGNVVDAYVLASIEYAVSHLGTPLVVVLGHTACGAVTAAATGGECEGHLGELMEAIRPAIEGARARGEDEIVRHAIYLNARMAAEQLRRDELIAASGAEVVSVIYDMDSGRAEVLES